MFRSARTSSRFYRDIYDREMKFVARNEPRVALMASDTDNAAFVEANLGGFPQAGPLVGLSQSYVEVFDPLTLDANAENWLKIITEGFRGPITPTVEGLKRDPSGWHEPTVFVVDPSSPLDLIDIWNIRLFQSQILPMNLAWLAQSKDFLLDFVKANHGPLRGNPNGLMTSTNIQFGRSITEERKKAAIEEAGLAGLTAGEWDYVRDYDEIWRAENYEILNRPRRSRVVATSSDLDLAISDEGIDGQHCQFTSLSPEFAELYSGSSTRWVNVLSFSNYGKTETLALTLPSSFTGEDSRRFRLGDGTIISREGFVLPQRHKQNSEYLRLLTGSEAVIIWFKRNGIEAEPSDPGRIADQILESVGGLRYVRVIADMETIKLLDDMSKSVTKYADGKTEEFPDRSVEVKKWKDLMHRRNNKRLGGGASLDRLIEANVLRLGLVLECTNCKKKNWFGIQSLSERLTCERCLKIFPFPQGSLQFDRTPWQLPRRRPL